jgi:hypothetical protein
MAELSIPEKVEIIRLVGDNVRSNREAAREFNARHPERPPIHHSVVANVNRLFNVTGNVVRSRPRINRRHPLDAAILAEYHNNPCTSLRDMARNLNITYTKIWRCLRRHKLKPYKPKFLHTLEEGDTQRRMEYCLWCQGNYLNDREFLKNIMFSDEATFTTNGVVSAQNCRYWATENPNWVINCKRQYSQKVNVWCALLNTKIIGPFFFFNTLNAERFLNFLNTEFMDAIEELPLIDRRELYIQLDGASVHNARIVRTWLDDNFPLRWIGRNSSLIEWPPRSPDITPLDFFLWGSIKNVVYKTRPQNIEQLCDRIRQACREISAEVLRRVVVNNRRRIEKCVRLQGDLVERGVI